MPPRLKALLDGKNAAKKPEAAASAASAGRFIVQIGAYAEVLKAARPARSWRKPASRPTPGGTDAEGKRIRVRVGPFESRQRLTRWLQRSRSSICLRPFWNCKGGG